MPPVAVFPYLPDAARPDEPMLEGLDYDTDVLTAETGMEQRIQLRGFARGALEFTLPNLTPTETTGALGLLRAYHAEQWWVPAWMYAVKLSAGVTAGGLVLPCTAPEPGATLDVIPWAHDDGEAYPYLLVRSAVWTAVTDYSVVRLASVSGLNLNLLDPVGTFAAGAYVVPLRIGRLDQETAHSLVSTAVALSRVRWMLEGTAD